VRTDKLPRLDEHEEERQEYGADTEVAGSIH
jgi:hypothetical protein